MPERIVHVSFSSSGGAGSVARIIADQQRAQGRDSQLLTVVSSDLRTSPLSAPRHTFSAGWDEYIIKRNSFHGPISLLRDSMPGIDLEAIETADILHLHGVNGAVNISSLERLDPATRVVWTLHDMNSFTGVCHYSLGCSNFTQQCSECPAVRKAFQDPVKRSLQRKIVGVSNIKNLSLVAPSYWLAEQARRSSVLKNRAIATIANPVDPIFVSRESTRTHRRNSRQVRAIIAAQNLSDPVKQVELGIKGFLSALRSSDLATLTLVGKGGEHFKGPNIVLKGVLTTEELAREFEEADVLIVPSRAENSPLVVAEASALGCFPMVTDAGGMPSMVSDLDHGAVFSSAESLAQELHEFSALSLEVRNSIREKIGQRAREIFSPASVVENYDKVYAGA